MIHNVLCSYFHIFFDIFVSFFSSDCKNAELESPLYMELERETPLQEDNAPAAELNPVYDRFVCLF